MMHKKAIAVTLSCVLLISAGEMLRRLLSPSPTVIQSRKKIQQSQFDSDQKNLPHSVIHDSVLQEELQVIAREAQQLTAPKWVETSSWNDTPQRRDFGLKKARLPQYLWLDWFEVSGAVYYQIYLAYSKAAFKKGSEKYRLLATTKKTEYHSGDAQYLTGKQQLFRKTGYYRFKVAAIADDNRKSPLSKYYELILDRKSASVAPGISYNRKHTG